MKYKCIIFDCDGILVDSEAISDNVLIKMAEEQGYNLRPVIKEFSGMALQKIFDHIESETGNSLPDNFEKEFRSRTFEAFEKEIQPIKGVKELLERLELPICVASSGPPAKIRLNLTATGLIDHFGDKIYSAYDIQRWKPDPDIFLHAARDMGFSPNECVVIEDSPAGVKAANAGGFDVWALTPKEKQARFDGLDCHFFNDMRLLDQLLSE